jgi:hypothetical protein
LKKNPSERISLSDIKIHPCFILFDHRQFLHLKLEQAMIFYEKEFREIDFNNVFPTKQQRIKKHIFIGEKINVTF